MKKPDDVYVFIKQVLIDHLGSNNNLKYSKSWAVIDVELVWVALQPLPDKVYRGEMEVPRLMVYISSDHETACSSRDPTTWSIIKKVVQDIFCLLEENKNLQCGIAQEHISSHVILKKRKRLLKTLDTRKAEVPKFIAMIGQVYLQNARTGWNEAIHCIHCSIRLCYTKRCIPWKPCLNYLRSITCSGSCAGCKLRERDWRGGLIRNESWDDSGRGTMWKVCEEKSQVTEGGNRWYLANWCCIFPSGVKH